MFSFQAAEEKNKAWKNVSRRPVTQRVVQTPVVVVNPAPMGDSSSFGKGTVQAVIELNEFLHGLDDAANSAGALKITIEKVYRVTGESTQLKGVIADVTIPSLTDSAEFGESEQANPLAYDQMAPTANDAAGNHKPLFLDELRNRSIKRINEDPVFHDLSAEIQLIKWPRRLLASVPSNQAHRSILVGAYHEALQQRRRDQQSEEFRLQMHQRNAIEGTISELVRSHGLRRARYKGFAKADLQNQLIAAACNIKRWFRKLLGTAFEDQKEDLGLSGAFPGAFRPPFLSRSIRGAFRKEGTPEAAG